MISCKNPSAKPKLNSNFANQHYYELMQKNHPNVPAHKPAPACPASTN